MWKLHADYTPEKGKDEYTTEHKVEMRHKKDRFSEYAWVDLGQMNDKLYSLAHCFPPKDPMRSQIYSIMDAISSVGEEIRNREKGD